jgi:hypothetical protein
LEPQKARAANDPDEFCCASAFGTNAKCRTTAERRLSSGKLIADETEKWGKVVKFAASSQNDAKLTGY